MIPLRGYLLTLLSFGCLVLGVSSGPAALAGTAEAAAFSSYDDSPRDYDHPAPPLSSPTSPASSAIRGYDDDAIPARARNASAPSVLAAKAGSGAENVVNGVRLRAQLAGREIAGGHAFEKHVIAGGQFPGDSHES